MDVLKELERAALTIKSNEIDRISRRDNWEVGQNPDLQLFMSRQAKPQDMNLDAFLRFSKDATRVDSMAMTLRALLDTAQDLQKSYDEFLPCVVARTSKGIMSLPDELLLTIFHFASLLDAPKFTDDTIHRSETPTHISHVSRRCRRVALRAPVLWTMLHSDAKKDELAACVARSGQQADLRVVIDATNSHFNLVNFMDTCWKTAPRWKSLAIIEKDHWRVVDAILETMDQYDLHLLRLHGLHLVHDLGRRGFFDGATFTPSLPFRWSSPNLQLLCSGGYIPSPSPTFSFLSSFSIKFHVKASVVEKMQELSTFLSSTPSISHLELQLEGVSEPLDFGELVCFRLISFKLRLPSFLASEDCNIVIAEFIRLLRLPNLTLFSISIGLDPAFFLDGVLDEEESKTLLLDLARSVFPDHITHSRITSLDIELLCEMSMIGSRTTGLILSERTRDVNLQPRTFTIPLDRIPSVSSLTLTTFAQCRTRFTREEQPSIPEICNLRELRLRECKTIDNEELWEMVQSLKDVDAWDYIERVVVEGCDSLSSGEAFDIVGTDKLYCFAP